MNILQKKLMECVEAYRKARSYAISRGSREYGRCGEIALKTCAYYRRKKKKYRYVIGLYRGRRHDWCEYEEKGTWYIDDPIQDIQGWTREECRDYKALTETDPFEEIGGVA